jgi:hypothetical protein
MPLPAAFFSGEPECHDPPGAAAEGAPARRVTSRSTFVFLVVGDRTANQRKPLIHIPVLLHTFRMNASGIGCAEYLSVRNQTCGWDGSRWAVGAVSPAASYSSRGHLALNGSDEWNERCGVSPTISCHFQFAWRNREKRASAAAEVGPDGRDGGRGCVRAAASKTGETGKVVRK